MYTLKKSLGQHFLKDEKVSAAILTELQKCPCENLLEIGPGGGALTRFLIDLKNVNFKAVEIDEEKIAFLINTYPQLKDKIIQGDFLVSEKPFSEKFTVIGNFPYNISTQIVFKILEWKESVQCMIGMFQKEVAQRLAAKEGSKIYGVTSVLTQAFYDVAYLFEVDQNSFTPPPKVMSAVIKLTPRKQSLAMRNERSLRILVKAAFNQRRKTLRNAVRSLFEEKELGSDFFNRRAEQVSIEEFAALTFRMQGSDK